jgi:hypothetical protein
MQRTHEGMAPRGVGMIALARNPLRLTHMDIRDDIPRAAPAVAPQRRALLNALRWLFGRLQRAFLTAGSPTSVPRGGVDDDEKVEKRPPQRPGGSMLRRME